MTPQALQEAKTIKEKKILSTVKAKPYFNEDNFVLYHGDSLKLCNCS